MKNPIFVSIVLIKTVTVMSENRRLTRSANKMIGGVCAGLAEYMDLDPTIMRVIWVLMVLLGGFGIMLYLILWLIMPKA